MNFKIILLIASLFISNHIFANNQMASHSIWELTSNHEYDQYIDLSVYVSQSSNWSESLIKERLLKANDILKKCQISIRYVYFHTWIHQGVKVRVDDLETRNIYYDGMRNAAKKSLKVTPVQLFYFEDYLNPFSYGGSVPLAIYEDDRFPSFLQNSAWFPFQSVQTQKRSDFPYSEEAHELGHILLRSGHDHSLVKNLMANNSKLRINHFLPAQCLELKIPTPSLSNVKCKKTALDIFPLFTTYFYDYSSQSYMNTWCSRNSKNLKKGIQKLKLDTSKNMHAIYVKHKEQGKSIHPLQPRNQSTGWTFHAFLLIDGIVFDLDYKPIPTIDDLQTYLSSMWGEQVYDLIFQVRDVDEIDGHTRVEVWKTFKEKQYPQFNLKQFIEWNSQKDCS